MCHISEKNVWRIIEKASLPRKSVGTGSKGRISNLRARGERQLEERLSDFERKGETFPQFGGKCNKPGLFPRPISENSIPLSKFLKILLTTSA